MSAWGALIGGGATVIAASAAVAAGVVAVNTLRASKRDSRDRSRPMVGALLEHDPHPTGRTTHLMVRNYGTTVAYNVEVTFDPKIEDTGTVSGQRSFVPFLLNRYEKPIRTMMPGVELDNIWYVSGERDADNAPQNDEPIPDLVTATISYSDRADFSHKDTNRYVDVFTLDMTIIKTSVFSTHTDDHLGLHKRSAKALEKVAPALEQVAKDIHRIEGYVKPAEVREREEAEAARVAAIIEQRRAARDARLAELATQSEQGELTP
ncbi:hypothetical protein ACFQ6H_21230 [Rhodococcus sp. NPDC056506]|uniref:hypothetical protein n=1 Tax=Rhodococcus sp. NPDC056506 TaxID=3345844 RepID=UPI00366DCBB9